MALGIITQLTYQRMTIQKAEKGDAGTIASLIMSAMTDDCCLYYAGPEHTLCDFRRMMTKLVEAENTQYSYRNSLVAKNDEGELMGAIVTYDGARLHELRKAFVAAALESFGRDFSTMSDETQAGELYIDSFAVLPQYRGRGVATAMLKAQIKHAAEQGFDTVGLLVDKGNVTAQRLYSKIGFRFVNDSEWGGHPMKHLQIKTC